MSKYRCTVCGYVHEGELADDFICPVCKQPASVFEACKMSIHESKRCKKCCIRLESAKIKLPD